MTSDEKIQAYTDQVLEWLTGEIKKCIQVNEEILKDECHEVYSEDEYDNAYGRIEGLEYVLWLMEKEVGWSHDKEEE